MNSSSKKNIFVKRAAIKSFYFIKMKSRGENCNSIKDVLDRLNSDIKKITTETL